MAGIKIGGATPQAIAANVLSSTYTEYLNNYSAFSQNISKIIEDFKKRASGFEIGLDLVLSIIPGAINGIIDWLGSGDILFRQAVDAGVQAQLGYPTGPFGAPTQAPGTFADGLVVAATTWGASVVESGVTAFEGTMAQAYNFFYNDVVKNLFPEFAKMMEISRTIPSQNTSGFLNLDNFLTDYFEKGGGLEARKLFFDKLLADTQKGNFNIRDIFVKPEELMNMSQEERDAIQRTVNGLQTAGFYKEIEEMMTASRMRREAVERLFQLKNVTQAIEGGDQTAAFFRGIGTSIGRMLPAILLTKGLAAVGAGAGLKGVELAKFMQTAKLGSTLYFAGSVFSMSMEEAILNGASFNDALTYSTGTMLAELLTEQMGGIVLGEITRTATFKALLSNMLQEAFEEGIVEIVAKPFSAFSTKDGMVSEAFKNEKIGDFLTRIGYSALSGAVSSFIMGTPGYISSQINIGTKSTLGSAIFSNTQATALQELLNETVVGNEKQVSSEFSQRSKRVLKSLNRMDLNKAREIIKNNPIYQEILQEKTDANGKVTFELSGTSQEIVAGRILARDESGTLISPETHATSQLSPMLKIKNTLLVGDKKIQLKTLTKKEFNERKQALSKEARDEVDNLLKSTDNVVIVSTPLIPFSSPLQTRFSAAYDASTGIIYVNASNLKEGVSRAAAHEIYHKLQDLKSQGKLSKKASSTLAKIEKILENDKQYEAIASVLSKNGVQLNWTENLEKLYRKEYKDVPNIEKIIKEERVTNFIEDVLNNETALKALAAARDGKISQTIIDVMRNMFAQDPDTDAVATRLAQEIGVSKKDLLKNAELNPILKKVAEIQSAFTKVLQIAEPALKRKEDLSEVFGVNYRTGQLFSFSDEDKEKIKKLREQINDEKTRKNQITDIIAENSEVSREFTKDLILHSINSLGSGLNFPSSKELDAFLSDLRAYKRDANYSNPNPETFFSQELNDLREKLFNKLDMEFIDNESELGQRGFFFRTGLFYFNKEDFKLISPNLFVRNVSFMPKHNTFRVEFDNSREVLSDYHIYPSIIKPNGQVIKNPVFLNASITQPVLDYLLEYNVLPAQSFSVNNASAVELVTKLFSGYILDGENRFFVSLFFDKNILEKRDTFLTKNDPYTYTRRLDMTNPKRFKLLSTMNDSEFDMSVRANVKVMEKTIQGIVNRLEIMAKNLNESSVLGQLTTLIQNSINPKISPKELKRQIDEANKSYSRADLVDVYELALKSLSDLMKVLSVTDIGKILNTFINPETISGLDMSYFGLAEGNPNSQEFKEKVEEMNSLKNQYRKEFEALAEFYSATQYDIDYIAEGRASIDAEKQDIASILIINPQVNKELKQEGIYKKILDFAARNGIQVVVQTNNQFVKTQDPDDFFVQNKAAVSIRSKDITDIEAKKDNSKILFSLKPNYENQTIKERVELGKEINEVNDLEEFLSKQNIDNIFSVFGVNEYKRILPEIENYTKDFLFKMLEKTDLGGYETSGEPQKSRVRVIYILNKLLGGNLDPSFQGGIFGEPATIYQSQQVFFNYLLDYLSQEKVKKYYAEKVDFAINDYFEDGAPVTYYLPVVSQMITELLKFKKKTVLSIDGYRSDVVVNNIPNVDFISQEQINSMLEKNRFGFFKSINEIFQDKNANEMFLKDVQEVLEKEKSNYGNKNAGSLVFFKPLKTAEKTIFEGMETELYTSNYKFGFAYNDYGFVYNTDAFTVGSNEKIGNLKVYNGSIAPYFTFTVFRQNEKGDLYYQEKRVVSGDLFRKANLSKTPNNYQRYNNILETPVLLEFGASVDGALNFIKKGKSLSQSLSLSFANAPTFSTTKDFSPIKQTKNGFFKVRFIVNNPKQVMGEENFISKGDLWTPNRVNEVGVENYFVLESAGMRDNKISSEVFGEDSKDIIQKNRDIAALSLSSISSMTDFMENSSWFAEDPTFTYKKVISAKKLETVFRELVSAGFGKQNVNVSAYELKKLVSKSNLDYVSSYLKAIDNFKDIMNSALEIIESEYKLKKYTNVDKTTFPRILSNYISSVYMAAQGEFDQAELSLENQFDSEENNQFVKDLYEVLSKDLKAEISAIVDFLDGLPFNFELINEVKVSKISAENIITEIEYYGDAQDDPTFKSIIEEAKNKNIRVELINAGQKESVLSGKKYEKTKEIIEQVGGNKTNPFQFITGQRFASQFYDYENESAIQSIERAIKKEQIIKYLKEDVLFSLKDESLTREEKKKRFKEIAKKVFSEKEPIVKNKKEKAIEKKFAETIEEKQIVEKTLTPVSKTNFNTALGKLEKKASAYNALVRVVGTIRQLLELQRTNNFAKNNADLAAPISNALVRLNKIKEQLEVLVGVKGKVSPFDPNVIADKVNVPFLNEAEIAQITEERAEMIKMVAKEQQPQGIIDRQTNFVNDTISFINAFVEETLEKGTAENETEIVARPTLVEPSEESQKPAFNLYKNFLKALQWLSSYKKNSAFEVKPLLLKETISTIVRVENVVRELVATTNLQVKDVLNIYDASLTKTENFITKEERNEIERLLFRMTSFEAEKKFTIYFEAKELQDALFEDIINRMVKSLEQVKGGVAVEMQKDLAKQTKQLETEQKAKDIEIKIQREQLVQKPLSSRELKALWVRVYERRVQRVEKYLETLKEGSEAYEETKKGLKNMQRRLSEIFVTDYDKARDFTKDTVIKIFNEVNFKDDVPDALRELGQTGKLVKLAIDDKSVKNYEDFVQKYGKRLYKLAKEKYDGKEKVGEVRAAPYAGPIYVSLSEIKNSAGKITEAGTFVFEKPTYFKTYENKRGQERGKVLQRPGVQVTIKGTKESKYFRTFELAFDFVNRRVNQFIENKNKNNQNIEKSTGEKSKEVAPSSTQEVMSIPKVEDVVAAPATPETKVTPAEVKKPSKVWIPKEPLTVQYGTLTSTITPEEVQKKIAAKDWNFLSQEAWEQWELGMLQTLEQATQEQAENQRIASLQQQQTLVQPSTPSSPNSGGSGPKKVKVVNIFKTASQIGATVTQDQYVKNEESFSSVIEVILKRIGNAKNQQDQALFSVYRKLEQIIRKFRTENSVYNHISSSAAKAVIVEMDKIFRTISPKGKVKRIPTDQELANVAKSVNTAIFAALNYVDTEIRVKINESEANPFGFLYTKLTHWFLRDMKKVNTWDATQTQKFNEADGGKQWRRLMNAIYNFNLKGYGMVELAAAVEGFHLATQVQPIVDASLNEDQPRTVETIARQWKLDTENINLISRTVRFDEKTNAFINPLLDPMSVADLIGLYNKKSWSNVMMGKIIRGQERVFEIERVFEKTFNEEFLQKNSAEIVDLEKRTAVVQNLGGISVRMSQVIYLRNMIFREVVRNKAIDLGLIKGEKTNHFRSGYKINLLEISEFKQKKMDKKVIAEITNPQDLLKELDGIIQKDAFAKEYNQKVYKFFGDTYAYVNERFKELHGANLTNDGASIIKALESSSQSKKDNLQSVLPDGVTFSDLTNLYVPFLLDNSAYFKSQKLNFNEILDMGVFDGMVLELKDSSGRVSVESINNVLEGYKREVANYYGLHRIMRDLNILFNYEITGEDGQTYYINQNISKYAVNYFKTLLTDMAGYTNVEYRSELAQTLMRSLRRNFYAAALGYNVKVIFTQFATMLNLWNIYGQGDFNFLVSMIKNLASQQTGNNKLIIEKMLVENNVMWDRSKGGSFELREATREGVTKRNVLKTLQDFGMKGIKFTDNMINKSFYLTLLETTNPETGKPYTEAEASRTLTIGIIRSQSSSLAIAKSSLLRSQGDLAKIFLRFMGEPLKQVTQIVSSSKHLELINKLKNDGQKVINQLEQSVKNANVALSAAKNEQSIAETVENNQDFATQSEEFQENARKNIENAKRKVENAQRELEEREEGLKNVKEQIKETTSNEQKVISLRNRHAAAIFTSITYLSILGYMFELARTGGGEKDKPADEELWAHLTKKLGANFLDQIVGMFPIVRDIYGAFRGYDLGSVAELSAVNNFISSLSSIWTGISGGNINWNRTVYNTISSLSTMFGIPFRNLERLFTTPLLYISEPTWYQYQTTVKGGQNRDNIELAEAIRTNDTAMISVVIDRKLANREMSVSNVLLSEMKRLAGKGFEVTMTGVPDQVEIDGKKVKLTRQEKESFQKVYSRADAVAQRLMKTSAYRRLDDRQKARLINAVFAYYYKLAKQEVLGVDALSEKMTFGTLAEAYEYFFNRAEYYFENQRNDFDA